MKERATFTIEADVLSELEEVASELGEKKSRIVERAITAYFDMLDVAVAEKRLEALQRGEETTVPAEEVYKELGI